MSHAGNKHEKEKREYFRISQDVLFDFSQVDAFAAESQTPESEFEDEIAIGLLNELRRLDRDNAQTLRLLTEKNRLLGDYLRVLSSKIDLIARQTVMASAPLTRETPKARINLSEDGLAFTCDRALYKDSFIAVRLVFLPSYSPVVAFAKVLRCNHINDNYQIAARFYRLSPANQQELAKQVLRAQAGARKRASE